MGRVAIGMQREDGHVSKQANPSLWYYRDHTSVLENSQRRYWSLHILSNDRFTNWQTHKLQAVGVEKPAVIINISSLARIGQCLLARLNFRDMARLLQSPVKMNRYYDILMNQLYCCRNGMILKQDWTFTDRVGCNIFGSWFSLKPLVWLSFPGNFGQSNYTAAKAGLAADTVVWSKVCYCIVIRPWIFTILP